MSDIFSVKVAFITGQSNLSSNALSPAQHHFMKEIPLPETAKVYWNFPYDRKSEGFQRVNLFTASLNNSMQYLQSRRSGFANKYRNRFMEEFGGAEKIMLLSGSCGLELFRNLKLPESICGKVYIFAYGAVAQKRPLCKRLFLIRGRRDWIASLWRLEYDVKVAAGHLDYLENLELKEHCYRFIDAILAE